MIGFLAERSAIYGILAALCFGAGWKVQGWRLGEGIAQERAGAVAAVRYIEREQQKVADSEGANGHEELEKLRADAAAAGNTARGLRAEAGRLATRLATCNAGSAAERKARQEQSELLADVLASVEQEGRAMAEAADRARAQGMTCERVFDGVKAAR